jgi:acetyl esterase/lipase
MEFASRLLWAGVPTEFHVYPGGFHAYDLLAEARISQATVRHYFSALRRAFHG